MNRQRQRKKRKPVKLRDALRQSWLEYEKHGGVSHDQFWAELANEVSPRKKKAARAR